MSNLRKVELDESVVVSGDKKLMVVDEMSHQILLEILLQMKVMNTHLSLMTDENIKETDIEGI